MKMDFIDKKEKLADLLESSIEDPSKKDELLSYIDELKFDDDFRAKDLFVNMFSELEKYYSELSRRELKQRVLLIRSYLD